MFNKRSLSVINRPTIITKTSISSIDRMYVNSCYNQDLEVVKVGFHLN